MQFNNAKNEQNDKCLCGLEPCKIHPSKRGEELYDTEYNLGLFGDSNVIDVNFEQEELINHLIAKLQRGAKYEVQSNDLFWKIFTEKVKSKIDMEYLIKLLEDCLVFYAILTNRHKNEKLSKSTATLAVAVFVKLRWQKSVCTEIFTKDIMNFITSLFKMEDTVEVQSVDEMLFNARFALDSCSNILNSVFYKKIYKTLLYCLSMSLFDTVGITFDSLGFTKLQEAAMKKKFLGKGDFVVTLLDTILFIMERGYQVYKTQDINTIFHCGGKYGEIYDQCSKLKRQSQLLTNPEDHGFTESAFRGDLNNIIEKLTSIKKNSNLLDKFEQDSVRNMLNEMNMIYDDLTTKSSARQTRKCPFSVLIVGNSGIGKTSLTEMLYQYFCKIHGLRSEPEYRYTRNPEADFWDGFSTEMHTIVLDDIAARKPNTTEDKSISEVIQIMNSAPFCPNQASLDSKGRTPMKAKFVIATTNVKTLNAYHAFSCPSAVQRRFPFVITPTVKTEYLNERGVLDSSLVNSDTSFPDLWTFKVELVKPVPLDSGKSLADFVLIADNMNLNEFLDWFRKASRRFAEDQNKVFNSLRKMKEIDLCRECELPADLCNHVQTGDISVFTQIFSACAFVSLYCKYKRALDTMYYTGLCIYSWYMWFVWAINFDYMSHYTRHSKRILSRDYWVTMGNNIQKRLNHPKTFVAAASIITSGYFVYKFMKRIQIQSKETSDVGSAPKEDLEGRENVWYKNDIELTPFDVSRESSSSKSMEFTSFLKMIEPNCIALSIDNPNKPGYERPGKAFCIGGHIYITNNHNIPKIETSTNCRIIQTSSKDGVNRNITINITEKDLIRHPSKDLVFMILRSLPPKKNLMSYIRKESFQGIFDGTLLSRVSDGSIKYRNLESVKYIQHQFDFPEISLKANLGVWDGFISEPTELGDCGSLAVVKTERGYVILGLHVAYAGYYGKSMSTTLDYEFISKEIENLKPYSIQSSHYQFVSSPDVQREVGDLHKKSIFRYLKNGTANIHGSFQGFRGKGKSSVCNTPMSYHLSDKGYKIKYTKPDMVSWVPWHIAGKELVDPIQDIRSDILDKCVKSYIQDVFGNLKNIDNVSEMLHVLDDFTAINGAAGVSYIDKINRNTSAGNPWKKCKKFFLKSELPKHGMQDPVSVSEDVMERVNAMYNLYLEGNCVHPNFCAHLKDEPVTFKKAKIGKTRVFTGAPFDWTILVRKYLLSFTRLLQNERLAFEAAPGTIAQSLEWQELYEYITKFGDERIVAGDYKAFDKKMSPKEILAAFDVIIHFCEMSGNYTPEDIIVIRGIAEDTAFPLIDYNGDLIQFFGSNPSGHPLTVIINSIVNSLRMRYVYFTMKPDAEPFKECVNLMTYGDDNIMSVKRGVDWFNHTSISKQFESLGIIYTMADKEAESIPYIHISDASFLKRSWRFDDDVGCYLAPLDHDSIEKMLMVWNKSKTITDKEQGIAVVNTALREYFYYGKDIFNEKRKIMIELIQSLNWEKYVQNNTFPTFDELSNEFKYNSRKHRLFKVIYGSEIPTKSVYDSFDYTQYSIGSFSLMGV
jgi:hypothetical protein